MTDLRISLEELASRIELTVAAWRSSPDDSIVPMISHSKWRKVFSITHGDNGPDVVYRYMTVPEEWWQTFKARDKVKESREYAVVQKNLSERKSEDESKYILDKFVEVVLERLLGDEGRIVPDLIEDTMKYIEDHPFPVRASVELQNIVLPPDPIQFEVGKVTYTLRRPIKEDIEERVIGSEYLPTYRPPSAILEVQTDTGNPREMELAIGLGAAVLRLFTVGAIFYRRYRLRTKSLIQWLLDGTQWSAPDTQPLHGYLLRDSSKAELISFWEKMKESMPEQFYSGEDPQNFLEISYYRYTDALLRDGVVERRISTCVMGLEALLLDGEGELGFRLRMRIAKLLGLLYLGPCDVKELVGFAYKVRSSYVHGARLPSRLQRQIDERFSGPTKLLNWLLEYLRICIVTVTLLNRDKDELIKSLDDAMIDSDRDKELQQLLLGIRKDIPNLF